MPKRTKTKPPPGHADPEEYQRFLEAAKEVGASEDPKDFDRAFEKVTAKKSPPSPQAS
jgi:hypothetical protein